MNGETATFVVASILEYEEGGNGGDYSGHNLMKSVGMICSACIGVTVSNHRLYIKPYVDLNLDMVLLISGITTSILNTVDHDSGKEKRVWVIGNM
ncbi:hypothetical protein IGI04_014792 [Brassica rapa subsp. trilocularis]|uniref:Uncharacterized protein n=1 Tax=Brassica rapa subsp. trilocularis TaxID=1813537 RepID=A0ABQ7MN91_BRACM|nr:hypothetical protein IGI04_014792 [Brassica rapa subsp. trilocularis]